MAPSSTTSPPCSVSSCSSDSGEPSTRRSSGIGASTSTSMSLALWTPPHLLFCNREKFVYFTERAATGAQERFAMKVAVLERFADVSRRCNAKAIAGGQDEPVVWNLVGGWNGWR